MNVRFNDSLNPDSVNPGTVVVESCGDDSTCASPTPIAASRALRESLVPYDTIFITPNSSFTKNTWYRVTITTGIRSIADLPLKNPYTWTFKTRDDSSPCGPNRCLIAPKEQELEFIGDRDTYSLDSLTSSCGILTTPWDYDLTLDPASLATLVPTTTTTPATFDAIAQEDGRGTITAKNTSISTLFCTASLRVDVIKPKVVKKFPDCSSACTNASIGAEFNVPLREGDLTSSNITLFECSDSTCDPAFRIPVSISGITYDNVEPDGYTITFDANASLNPGVTYEVELAAGNIISEEGMYLEGNDGSIYRWRFTTKTAGSGKCAIDHITLEPKSAKVKAVGVKQAFTGQAYGARDECNPTSGQRLQNLAFNWANTDPVDPFGGWKTSLPGVAVIDRSGTSTAGLLDVLPPPGLTDPRQFTEAIGMDLSCGDDGICSTDVMGSVEPAIGETALSCSDGVGLGECANLTLVCGYSTDLECSAGLGLGDGYGVGYNTCCALRPEVVSSSPYEGQSNFCRNGIASVLFKDPIDPASINGNILLVKNVKTSACPVGSSSLLVRGEEKSRLVKAPENSLFGKIVFYTKLLFKKVFGRFVEAAYNPGDNLCIVSANIHAVPEINSGKIREVTIEPLVLLDTTQGITDEYALVIMGDDDASDGRKVGVRSRNGVTFVGETPLERGGKIYQSKVISFDTKKEICEITKIEHRFASGPVSPFDDPKMRTDTIERFFCVRDTCKEDIAATWNPPITVNPPGNQHYLKVKALDRDGIELMANWSYVEAGPNFFNRDALKLPDDRESLITVDDAFPGYGEDVRGTLTVIAENTTDATNIVAKSLGIHLFTCENPWPSIDKFPFQDTGAVSCDQALSGCPATNFEFYYCRDSGSPGTSDDLPALFPNPIVIGTPSELICYGGANPGASCASHAECDCPEGSFICTTPGVCASTGLKDIIFTREDRPRPPVDVTAIISNTAQQGGAISVSWTPPPSGVVVNGYKVYWGTQDGNYTQSMDVGMSMPVLVSNLNPQTKYYFAVTSYVRVPFGGAESSFSQSVSEIPKDVVPPLPPINVSVATSSPGQVIVSWDPELTTKLDVAGFRLIISISEGGSPRVVERRDVGKTEEYTLTLGSGVEYFFSVESYDKSGNASSPSSPISFIIP